MHTMPQAALAIAISAAVPGLADTAAPDGKTVFLSRGPLCFSVTARDDVLVWLTRSLDPFVVAKTPSRPNVRIVYVETASNAQSWGPPLESEAIFHYPAEAVHTIRKDEATWWTVVDDVLVAVSRTDATVHVIATHGSIRGRRTVMRLVREYSRWYYGTQVGLSFHGAVVTVDPFGGIVLTGGKFSGKTTMMTAMLDYTTADLVTNDVFSWMGSHALGWPKAVGVRLGTINLFARLDARVRAVRRGECASEYLDSDAMDEYVGTSCEAVSASRAKVRFTPREYAGIFNRAVRASTGIRVVALLHRGEDGARHRVRKLGRSAILDLMAGNALQHAFVNPWQTSAFKPQGLVPPNLTDTLFIDVTHTRSTLELLCQELVGLVR